MGWEKPTCCTSAVVERKSSMYLEPMTSLCLANALDASSSREKRTKASPVALPSGLRTKRTPSSESRTSQDLPSSSPLAAGSSLTSSLALGAAALALAVPPRKNSVCAGQETMDEKHAKSLFPVWKFGARDNAAYGKAHVK